jgi:type I restriction enzyme R subunit
MPNQSPEQLARDKIDSQLIACGWIFQNKSTLNLSAGIGIAVREYKPMLVPQIIFSL